MMHHREDVGDGTGVWYEFWVSGSESDKSGKPSKQPSEEFDAVKAAEELAASLGIDGGPGAAAAASSAAYEETLERELEQLNALLDAKDQKIASLEAALVAAEKGRESAQEEIQRASARIVKEELKKREQKHRKLLLEFLEVLDDFDRALEAITSGGHPEDVLAGIEIVRKSFVRRLTEQGVVHYDSMAQPFDPNIHDAVTLVPVTDKTQDGKVIAVVREGYSLGEECLRPARVAVGKRG